MKNESVKKSLEKSKNVLEEKRKIVKQKICIKKTHVNKNCYEHRSRATKNLKKTNTPLRVVKNQEHRNIAPLILQLHSYKQNHHNICFKINSRELQS